MPRSIRTLTLSAMLLAAAMPAALAAALSLAVLEAEAVRDTATGQPAIGIAFDTGSAEALAAFTRDHVGRQIVIRIDGEDVMSPIIREPILGGEILISGNMTMADAEALAARLSAGDAKIEFDLVGE